MLIVTLEWSPIVIPLKVISPLESFKIGSTKPCKLERELDLIEFSLAICLELLVFNIFMLS
jgi:hypothetical protein